LGTPPLSRTTASWPGSVKVTRPDTSRKSLRRAAAGALLLATALVGATTDGDPLPAPVGDEIAPGDKIEQVIDDESRLRRLLAVTGFEARSAQLATMMSQQVTASMGGHTGYGTEQISRLLSNPIDTDKIQQNMIDALLADYDRTAVNTLTEWYASPTGEKLIASIGTANSPGGQGQFDAYSRRIQSESPGDKRMRAAARIDRATQTSPNLLTIVVATNVMVTNVIDRIFGVDRTDPRTQAAMKQLIRGQIEKPVRRQSHTYALFAIRSLTTRQVAEYEKMLQSEAAGWFYRTAWDSYRKSVQIELAAFVDRIDEWLGYKDPEAYRAAARAKGVAWGKLRQDQQCLEEAFRQDKLCRDMLCEASLADFIQGCLETSRRSDGYCSPVTPSDDEGALLWRTASCRNMRRRDRVCLNMVTRIQTHCDERRTSPEG